MYYLLFSWLFLILPLNFIVQSSCLVETDNKRSIWCDEIQEENANEIKEDTTFRTPEFNSSQPNLQTPSRVQTPYRHHYHTENGRGILICSVLVSFTISFHLLITCISYFVAGRFLNQRSAQRAVPTRHISHQHNMHETGGLLDARTTSRQLDWQLTTVPSQRSSGKNSQEFTIPCWA